MTDVAPFFLFGMVVAGREQEGFSANSSLVSKLRTAVDWERFSCEEHQGLNFISQPKGKKMKKQLVVPF